MSDMATDEQQHDKTVRIFVGGLAESVTAGDLCRLFGSLGIVEGVETIRTKGRSFAYVDFIPSPIDEKSLSKLFSKYNGCLWKGGKLKLEKAKEHYISRLKREWEEDAAAAESEIVISKPETTNTCAGKLEEKFQTKESLKTKQLHIYFPRLRKVKSMPFTGTGKHKYSFQNIKVPPLPVHFCDCEEHSSPSSTARGKPYFDSMTENGGMNDEEINIMNAVMDKLLRKENVSSEKHLEKEQDSFQSPDALHSDECEVDSATDEDDLIINMDTKKNKSALTGSQELEILENQESWLNKTRVAKEEMERSTHDLHNSNSRKKRKSLPTLEREGNGHVSTTAGGKSSKQSVPEKLGSGAESSHSKVDYGESTKVSWSQKFSWKKLIGDGGNTAFNASLILPKFDSGEEQQISDSEEEQRSDSEEQQISDSEVEQSSDGGEQHRSDTEEHQVSDSEEEQRSDSEEEQISDIEEQRSDSEEEQISDSEEEQRSNGEEQQRSDNEEHQVSDSEEQQISDSEEQQISDSEEQRSDREEQQISDSEEQRSNCEEQRSNCEEQQRSDGKEEQRSDSPSLPIHTKDKTEITETDEYLGNKPTNMDSIQESVEVHPTNAHVMEEHAEAQPTGKNVAPNKTGRGAAWRHKQSWTQLVSTANTFSMSQILPGITFSEPMTKEPTVDPANSNDRRHNGEAKNAINEVVSNGFDLAETIPEKSQHVGTNDIASAPIVEKMIVIRPREGSSEETIPKESFRSNVEIGETCTFMRSSDSLKEWAKAKAAMSGSLKRKRGEKRKEH